MGDTDGDVSLTSMTASQLSVYLESMVERVVGKSLTPIQEAVNSHTNDIAEIKHTNELQQSRLNTHDKMLDDRDRIKNIVIFGLDSSGSYEQLDTKVMEFFVNKLELPLSSTDVDYIRRLGRSDPPNNPPVLVALTTRRMKKLIFGKAKLLSGSGISIGNDYSKETLAHRKPLVPLQKKLKEKGYQATLKGCELYVKQKKTSKEEAEALLQIPVPEHEPKRDKRHRDQADESDASESVEGPHDLETKSPSPANLLLSNSAKGPIKQLPKKQKSSKDKETPGKGCRSMANFLGKPHLVVTPPGTAQTPNNVNSA